MDWRSTWTCFVGWKLCAIGTKNPATLIQKAAGSLKLLDLMIQAHIGHCLLIERGLLDIHQLCVRGRTAISSTRRPNRYQTLLLHVAVRAWAAECGTSRQRSHASGAFQQSALVAEVAVARYTARELQHHIMRAWLRGALRLDSHTFAFCLGCLYSWRCQAVQARRERMPSPKGANGRSKEGPGSGRTQMVAFTRPMSPPRRPQRLGEVAGVGMASPKGRSISSTNGSRSPSPTRTSPARSSPSMRSFPAISPSASSFASAKDRRAVSPQGTALRGPNGTVSYYF